MKRGRGARQPPDSDRLPPHSIEVEQGCLGCVMLDPEIALPVLIPAFGDREVFYDLRHQEIFRAQCELYREKVPIDLITLGERLRIRGQLDAVGGTSYLSALADWAPSAHQAPVFAAIVNEKSSLRPCAE